MATEVWRLLGIEEVEDCFYNMSVDEAILNAVSKGSVPNTIRFYRWKRSAVTIGYFQSMKKVVDVAACQNAKVDYTRRITGGGAVYHDYEGELTYSIICKEANPKIQSNLQWIIDKAMAKDPNQRYQSGAELLEDLIKVSHGKDTVSIPALPPSPPKQAPKWILWAEIGVILAILAIILFSWIPGQFQAISNR